MTEEQLQAQCFQWHWNEFPEHRQMLYHNNNNSVNYVKGSAMKAIGVVKGVSDFTLIVFAHVIFIEMKTEIGLQKTEQKEFQRKVVERGHQYIIVRTFEDFKKLINGIYGL